MASLLLLPGIRYIINFNFNIFYYLLNILKIYFKTYFYIILKDTIGIIDSFISAIQ